MSLLAVLIHFIQVLQKAKATFFPRQKVDKIVFINRPQHSYEQWNLFWKIISQRPVVTEGIFLSFYVKKNKLPSLLTTFELFPFSLE